jgi:hypothetical protein
LGKVKGRQHLGDLGGRSVLYWILENCDVGV